MFAVEAYSICNGPRLAFRNEGDPQATSHHTWPSPACRDGPCPLFWWCLELHLAKGFDNFLELQSPYEICIALDTCRACHPPGSTRDGPLYRQLRRPTDSIAQHVLRRADPDDYRPERGLVNPSILHDEIPPRGAPTDSAIQAPTPPRARARSSPTSTPAWQSKTRSSRR